MLPADFDCIQQRVHFDGGQSIPYDFLVLAAGATHHYFGQDADWEPKATGMKTIEDATEIRRKILSAFETAERVYNLESRAALLTFVVVGDGPTGIEMAGAICELARHTLKNDFRSINPATARVVLIENGPGVLNSFHVELGEAAKKSLIPMGAEVWNGTRLSEIHQDHVILLQHGKSVRFETRNVIWAAGVKGTRWAQNWLPRLADSRSLIKLDALWSIKRAVSQFTTIFS